MLLLVLLVEVVVLLMLLVLGHVVAVPSGEGVVVVQALSVHGPVGGRGGSCGGHVPGGVEVVLVRHVLLHGCCGGCHARVRVHPLSPSPVLTMIPITTYCFHTSSKMSHMMGRSMEALITPPALNLQAGACIYLSSFISSLSLHEIFRSRHAGGQADRWS